MTADATIPPTALSLCPDGNWRSVPTHFDESALRVCACVYANEVTPLDAQLILRQGPWNTALYCTPGQLRALAELLTNTAGLIERLQLIGAHATPVRASDRETTS